MEEDNKQSIAVIEKEEINSLETQKQENQETETETKKKSKLILTLVIATIILIIGVIFSMIFAIINSGNTEMVSGIKVANINISKKSEEEAKKILEEIYSEKSGNEIFLTSGEFEMSTTYKALDVKYNIDKAIHEAYLIGRTGNIFKDNYDILKAKINGIQVEPEVTIDNDMIEQVVENINNTIDGAVVQPDYTQEENKLIITSGQKGVQVDRVELSRRIYKTVRSNEQIQEIKIPLLETEPDQIDIDKIHKEVYKEVKDAYYTKDPFTIYPEVLGIDFDVENAKKIISEEKEKYEIPLIITKPEVTTQDLGTEAFPDQLSTFSTKYQESNVNRTTNLRLAAEKINGTVLLPGEEFSYNKTVGERTVAAGFKEAAVFNAGRVENGLGGGICQISSTLYDAVVMANLEVTVRRNHQFVTSYLKAGADATVVWGSQDFKFKNTRKYPIRLTATVQGGTATIQVWGVKEKVEYDITIETKKIATIPFTTQTIPDSSLPIGQQKVIQAGKNGQKVEAYKVTKLNGEIVSKTLLSKDTYNAMKKIVHVGTAQ